MERRACRRLEQLPGWLDGRVLWFDDGDLRRLASGRSYERGAGYVDAIGELDELPDGVVATVHGGAAYRVTLLEGDDGTLAGACSCPYGQEGAFCKHCVAVGLALLADAPAGAPWDQPRPAPVTGRPGASEARYGLPQQALLRCDRVDNGRRQVGR